MHNWWRRREKLQKKTEIESSRLMTFSRSPTHGLTQTGEHTSDLNIVCCARFFFFLLWAQRSVTHRRLSPTFHTTTFFWRFFWWTNVNKIPKAKIPFGRKKIIFSNQKFCSKNWCWNNEFCPINSLFYRRSNILIRLLWFFLCKSGLLIGGSGIIVWGIYISHTRPID